MKKLVANKIILIFLIITSYSIDSLGKKAAIVVDFDTKEGLDFLNIFKQTIEIGGKYPVKIGKGVNYHDMQDITEKFNG